MRKKITTGVLTAGMVGVLLTMAAPLTAIAHDFVISSTPQEGEALTALPEQFSITASGELLDLAGDGSGFGILVTDAAGLYYGDGCPVVDGATLSTTAALGEAGGYRLTWQVISSDGHPASGEVNFTWTPTDESQISGGSETVPVCGETVIAPPVSTETAQPTAEPEDTPTPISAPIAEEATNPAAPWIIGGGVIAMLAGISGMVWLWRTKQGPFRHRGL
jgi:copper resistance protein C